MISGKHLQGLGRYLAGLLVVLVVLCTGQPANAGCPSFSDVISNGSYAVSDQQGRVLGSCNIDTSFIPASIIKIPTALAALETLGSTYRFKTEFFIDSSRNLYIKGFGDPLLISEEVLGVLERLYEDGLREVADILIDDSAFNLEQQPPGRGTSTNPYDAPVGATVVNFNSVSFRVGKKHYIRSAEPLTPTVPIMIELGRSRVPGRYLINICKKTCNPEERMARYVAELFRAQMQKVGITVHGTYGRKLVPAGARLLYSHENSRSLDEVLASMLMYSSNFIANLVYLTIGAEKYGYPATWKKADQAVHESLVLAVGEQTVSHLHQVEGSGLSRKNTLTARTMLKLLQAFTPYTHLLRKRKHVFIKTGTMKGIYNYAGYLRNGNPFVVMLNQQRNTRTTVLDRLKLGTY